MRCLGAQSTPKHRSVHSGLSDRHCFTKFNSIVITVAKLTVTLESERYYKYLIWIDIFVYFKDKAEPQENPNSDY